MHNYTFRESNITFLPKAHRAIRQPQCLFGEEEHLGVQAELSSHWVTDLKPQKHKALQQVFFNVKNHSMILNS